MQSKYHQTSMELASTFQKCYSNPSADVIHQIDQSCSKREEKARQILLPIVKTVLFCGRQGIALPNF